jgi:hypothetical protein
MSSNSLGNWSFFEFIFVTRPPVFADGKLNMIEKQDNGKF